MTTFCHYLKYTSMANFWKNAKIIGFHVNKEPERTVEKGRMGEARKKVIKFEKQLENIIHLQWRWFDCNNVWLLFSALFSFFRTYPILTRNSNQTLYSPIACITRLSTAFRLPSFSISLHPLFSLVMFYKLHFNWLEINCYSFIHFSHFLVYCCYCCCVARCLVLSSYIRRLIEFNRH